LSQADDNVYKSAKFAHEIQNASGIGRFSAPHLSTYLLEKDIHTAYFIDNTTEGINARGKSDNLETMLQTIWLSFTQPRFDEKAFQTWQSRRSTELRYQMNSPVYVLKRTQADILYDYHLRGVTTTTDDVLAVNHRVSFDFFKSRFESIRGFNFIFVGNINPIELHPYIQTYIASLPGKKANINVVDRSLRMTEKQTREVIHKGQGKASVVMQFVTTQKTDWATSQKMAFINSLLREMLFIKAGDWFENEYTINTDDLRSANQTSLAISFSADPDNVDVKIAEVNRQIALLLDNEIDDDLLERAKTNRKRELRGSPYWLSAIKDKVLYGYTSEELSTAIPFLDTFISEDIANVAKSYLDFEKCITVVLLPEEE